MGASHSGLDSAANKLAVGALAHVVHFNREKVLVLQKEFHRLAEKDGRDTNTITRESFDQALEAAGIHPQDQELMARMFVLFDHTGSDTLNFKEFLTGVGLLVTGSTEERLKFSFLVHDIDGTGKITKEEMTKVLKWQANTASFFGDKPVKPDAIVALVKQIFLEASVEVEEKEGGLPYAEYMKAAAAHPAVVDFVQQPAESAFLVEAET